VIGTEESNLSPFGGPFPGYGVNKGGQKREIHFPPSLLGEGSGREKKKKKSVLSRKLPHEERRKKGNKKFAPLFTGEEEGRNDCSSPA